MVEGGGVGRLHGIGLGGIRDPTQEEGGGLTYGSRESCRLLGLRNLVYWC